LRPRKAGSARNKRAADDRARWWFERSTFIGDGSRRARRAHCVTSERATVKPKRVAPSAAKGYSARRAGSMNEKEARETSSRDERFDRANEKKERAIFITA
jgi:hypothetical protein